MDHQLESMWKTINTTLFEGKLSPLAAINWEETSGPNGIGAHGKFVPQSKCIMIDQKFRFDEGAKSPKEIAKRMVALSLLVHEMVHHALHERGAPSPGQHGEAFMAEARRISKIMGGVEPSKEDLAQWPVDLGQFALAVD